MMAILHGAADPAAFAARVTPFLAAHEAAHSVILGVLGRLARAPLAGASLAAVEEAGTVVAVALRTPPHPLLVALTDRPAALDLLADDLYRRGAALPGAIGPVPASATFAATWRRLTRQPYQLAMRQRIYAIERVIPVRGVPGALRAATAADLPLLYAWSLAFHTEAEAGAVGHVDPRIAEEHITARFYGAGDGLALWWDAGRPVALAGYTGPTPGGIRVGPVYTPPECRRRGYASALTAALSRQLLDGGYRRCFLTTDLANPTSNRIYQAIGYEPVCDVEHYRFGP